MKQVSRNLLVVFCLFTSLAFTDSSQNQNSSNEIPPVIWVAPGFYYGMWFDDEDEYNTWTHDHYHEYRRDHPYDQHREEYHTEHRAGDRHDHHMNHGREGGHHGSGHGGGHGRR